MPVPSASTVHVLDGVDCSGAKRHARSDLPAALQHDEEDRTTDPVNGENVVYCDIAGSLGSAEVGVGGRSGAHRGWGWVSALRRESR